MSRLKTYYTESEIQKHLYTNGNQFMTPDKKEYRGTYHRYLLTGEIYTLGEYSKKSKKLVKLKIEDPIVSEYKRLKPEIKTTYKTPKDYILRITADDIKQGFVIRYFIKKVNSLNITEINQKQYDAYDSKKIDINLYEVAAIKWLITGQLHDTIDNGVLTIGVKQRNENTVQSTAKTFKGLNKKILNFTEYFTDTDFVISADINNPDSSTPTSSY